MPLPRSPWVRGLVLMAIVTLVGVSVYALTAANTVPSTSAGSGTASVSGFTITNLHYMLDAATPTNIDAVTFDIGPAVPSSGSGTVSLLANLTTGTSVAYSCTTDPVGTTATCATTSPQLSVDSLSSVTVSAAQ